jgi:hypothetical protein
VRGRHGDIRRSVAVLPQSLDDGTEDATTGEGVAVVALADALRTTSVEPTTYEARRESGSGGSPDSRLAREHQNLITALRLFLCRDRVRGFELAGIEHLSRRILQILKAVWTGPRAPNFDGLGSYMQHCADTVAVLTPAVDTSVTAHQKDHASSQEQSRFAAEEATSRAKCDSDRIAPNTSTEGKPPEKKRETKSRGSNSITSVA